jgi:hypothetical protein
MTKKSLGDKFAKNLSQNIYRYESSVSLQVPGKSTTLLKLLNVTFPLHTHSFLP